MKKFLQFLTLLFITLLLNITCFAQVLEKTVPFSSGTPFHEPDGRREYFKLSDKSFITISKIKGNVGGPSEMVLERYDYDLTNIYKSLFTLDQSEEIKEFYVEGKDIVVLSILHVENMGTATLKATLYDVNTGQLKTTKNLAEVKVNKWFAERSRGAIKQSFDDMVCAAIGRNFTASAPYKFEIKFSPDQKIFIAYIFDYSAKNLNGTCYAFTRGLEKINEGNLHVDNNFTNYGIAPNNRGEVYILNGDRQGRIAVVQYNLKSRQYKYLDIQNASSRRESLTMKIVNDDVVFVANVVLGNNKLVGVMYSKFNFLTNLVERANFHDLTPAVKQTMEQSWEFVKQAKSDNWSNYDVSDFYINEEEHVTLTLEKREIQTTAYAFDQSNTVDLDKWFECTGHVYTGGLFMFNFNKKDELIWENAYAKYQIADLNTGTNTASYVMDNSQPSKLRMVFSTSDNAGGIFNTLNYVEWDKASGKKIKDLQLPNDLGLGIIRSYTQWKDNQLILAGRKGLLGKKSFLCSYKLE